MYVNIILDMILCVFFNYHTICPFSAAKIRFLWSRILSHPTGAAHHDNTRCSGSVSCLGYQMLCLSLRSVRGAARRKTELCSGRNRATLPESREYVKNRIT
ncbi:hypothetical protein E3156_26960 (plasmid) [Escherichia coli O55:H7]|nr:hypothetical protein E3156_26960 [Escherichia coli O55:H7]